MTGSFLRKKRPLPRISSSSRNTSKTLQHSLSLPDLTTPLLDPASWEELPQFSGIHLALPNHPPPLSHPPLPLPLPLPHPHSPPPPELLYHHSPPPPPPPPPVVPSSSSTPPPLALSSSPETRNRAPTSINRDKEGHGHGSPVQFHRPFTPWQVVNHPHPQSSPEQSRGAREMMDFRISQARWGRERDSFVTQGSVRGGQDRGWKSRRRGKSRVLQALNVIVVGGKRVGKTSLIDLLIDSLEVPLNPPRGPTSGPPGPPPPNSPRNIPLPPSPPRRPTSGAYQAVQPTTTVFARVTTVLLDGYERTRLRLIDTPGLELGNDPVNATERERGVAGVLRFIEERFEDMLREERKVVRRQGTSEDRLVHLILYLIDARSVLRPRIKLDPTEIDWSGVGVFDDGPNSPRERHRPLEIIRRLSQRAHVLPVLTHSDALTTTELNLVRGTVRNGLSAAFPDEPGLGFGIFGLPNADEASDDMLLDKDDEAESSSRAPTPALTVGSHDESPSLPFAIFAPEGGIETHGVRRFVWGEANVLDPKHNDLLALRDAILGDHAGVRWSET
ncbi:hypothetical protein BCR39DRAFT_494923 [Naematelia encephala]|uniref:Septin-type G domain-containing protein n=1 Tax=Naematelia encephala TaxID=71784 RepID=A0A1Y2B5F9_9TREE|nr:hypothetical protein BCR39DRAFT_494923 [Naematelia encephala]